MRWRGMLVMHPKSQCNICKHEPRIVQEDNSEASEFWKCRRFSKISDSITVHKQPCRFFKQK